MSHRPTEDSRRLVEELAGLGIPQPHIARLVGIGCHKTLSKHYADELEMGKAKANATVARRLFQIITEGEGREALTATIFWMKTQCRWSEKHDVEQNSDIKITVEYVDPPAAHQD